MTLKNSDPEFVQQIFATISEYLSNYGWFIIAAIIVVAIVWNKYAAKLLDKWRENRETRNTDPNTVRTRAEAMEEARRRLQERYETSAEQHNQKLIEQQMKKRQQLSELENSSSSGGNQLRKRTDNSPKSLFGDKSFNPLMGSSSSSSTSGYRPARKNCGPSGG